jgi:hypothetical protein
MILFDFYVTQYHLHQRLYLNLRFGIRVIRSLVIQSGVDISLLQPSAWCCQSVTDEGRDLKQMRFCPK